MAIRTLNSPGIQINERDLSQYTTGPIGTSVLVTGFASKGIDYTPTLLTSRSAWIQQFGEPTNEAERYFFNACMEVINQGGTLYACKLPYKNDSLDKFTAKTYTVDTNLNSLSTVYDYINKYDLGDILAGNFVKFDDVSKFNDIEAVKLIFNLEDIKDKISEFSDSVETYISAIPYIYSPEGWNNSNALTSSESVLASPTFYICESLSTLFSNTSQLWNGLAEHDTLPFNKLQLTGTGYEFKSTDSVETNYNKFINLILEGLGLSAYPKEDEESNIFKAICFKEGQTITSIGIENIKNEGIDLTTTGIYNFYKDNEGVFNKINGIDLSNKDNVEKYGDRIPYLYIDENKCNIGSYLVAAANKENSDKAKDIIDNFDAVETINNLIKIDNYLDIQNVQSSFDKIFNALKHTDDSSINTEISTLVKNNETEEYETYYGWVDNPQTEEELTKLLIEKEEYLSSTSLVITAKRIVETIDELSSNPIYEKLLETLSNGLYHDTPFAKFAIQYYMDNTNINNSYDKKTLREATNLNILFKNVNGSKDKNFFETYNNEDSYSSELSTVNAVVNGAIKVLSYNKFVEFVKEFVETEKFEELRDYANASEKQNLKTQIEALDVNKITNELAFSEITNADSTIKKYLTIKSDTEVELIDLETVDGYATGETPVGQNKIVIVDKVRGSLGSSITKTSDGITKEIVGIIPVITTAANALYVQALLETGDSGIYKYNAIKTAKTLGNADVGPYTIEETDTAIPFISDFAADNTVSKNVAGSFPSIHVTSDGVFDRQNIKKIGVVVLRAYIDPGEGNKVNYDIVEAFAGELDKNAVDPNSGASTFIDTLINNQSEYIEFYSNCFNQPATKKTYSEVDMFVIEPQTAGNLGFYQYMTEKKISLTDSITKALPLVWEKNEDINEKQIDIVCDAGVSNIAQFIKSVFNGTEGIYDPNSEEAALFKLRKKEDTETWRTILGMYDNFCKNIRQDCMFIADGPRPFCLTGNKKIVRPSKPSNTVDGNILPLLKYITGINTNYGAGYCNWFKKADEFSGDYFWCPPSIQAMGVYLNTDINFDFWMAPAGLNRGVIAALDVAFNPTQKQSNEIYPKCWNYARSYPNDGIVLEGQRTFQTKPTKLDRVHARRTMLRLERMVYQIARYYVYETNNTFNRQRFFDAVDGIFKQYKSLGAMTDYKIICDESINTPDVIDNNEFRVKIGVKIPGIMEFIMIEFNILRTGGSWTEML